MYFKKKGPPQLDREKLKKGEVLAVKVPPFYDKEYLYEIIGAGGKLVRARLFHSPTVKKQWSFEDLDLLAQTGMARIASAEDLQKYEAQNRNRLEQLAGGEIDEDEPSDVD